MNKRSIWKRPKDIKKRKRIGDWEIDIVVSGHGGLKECLLTIIDRKSCFIIAKKLKNRLSETVLVTLLKT